MAYNLKYTIPIKTDNGYAVTARIYKQGYSGSSSELQGAAIPFTQSLKSDNDQMEDRIFRCTMRIQLDCTTNEQFREFANFDPKEYKATVYKSTGYVIHGWVVPDYYEEPWNVPPYTISILITDGLGELKNVPFLSSEGKRLTGKQSLMTVLGTILSKTNLSLAYKEAINLYEENHNQTDNDTMLNQTYCDVENFEDDSGEVMDCYTVLDEVLKLCGPAHLWQENGYWWIVSMNNRKSSFVCRRYDSSFTYMDTATEDKVKEIILSGGKTVENFWWAEPTLNILPGWKKFILLQNLNPWDNLLKFWNFRKYENIDMVLYSNTHVINNDSGQGRRPGVFRQSSSEYLVMLRDSGGNGYLEWYLGDFLADVDLSRLGLKIEVNIGLGSGASSTTTRCYIRVFVKGSDGTKYYLRELSGTNKYYNAEWAGHSTDRLTITQMEMPAVFITTPIPIDGDIYLDLYEPSNPDATSNLFLRTYDDIKVTAVQNTSYVESIEIETEINDKNNYVPEDFVVMLGDLPTMDNSKHLYKGGLYRKDGTSYIPTEKWKIAGSDGYKNIVNHIADNISINHVKPQWVIVGDVRANFTAGTLIHDQWADRYFIMKRFDYDIYHDDWNIDAVQLCLDAEGYLLLRSGGYIRLRDGGRIKLRN